MQAADLGGGHASQEPTAGVVSAGAVRMSWRVDGDRAEVALRGELDLAGVEPLGDELRRIEKLRLPEVRVDLTKLEFIDSTGLQLLVLAHIRCQRQGTRMTLHHPRPIVRRVFELTGLIGSLTVVE